MKKSVLVICILILFSIFGCSTKNSHINHSTTILMPSESTMVKEKSTEISCFTKNDFRYLLVDNGVYIKRYLNENKVRVIIPLQLDRKDVKVLGRDSFNNLIKMRSVTIPNSVETIEGSAFYKCYSLEKIFIPSNIKNIGSNPFFKCSSLQIIEVDSNNLNYCSIDGVLFNKDKTVLIAYPEGKKQDIYYIPDGVKKINQSAFGYWAEIKKIYIPTSVTEFGSPRLSARNEKLILIVEQGSAALEYAIKNNLPYEIKK